MSTKADFFGTMGEVLRYKANTLHVMYYHERQVVVVPVIMILVFSLLSAIPVVIATGWTAGISMFFVTLVALGSVFLFSLPREMSNSLVTPIVLFLATGCIIWLTLTCVTLKTFFHWPW
jgi:hypothetical protein